MDVERGDIFLVRAQDLDIKGSEQKNSRPYVIMSRSEINRAERCVVGIPLTKQVYKAGSYRIFLPARHLIPNPESPYSFTDSVALTEQMRVLDKDRLTPPRIGKLTETAIEGLAIAIAYLFDIR